MPPERIVSFLGTLKDLRDSGMTEDEIADKFDLTLSEFRAVKAIAQEYTTRFNNGIIQPEMDDEWKGGVRDILSTSSPYGFTVKTKEKKCFLGISSSGWLSLFTAGSVGIIFMVKNGKLRR